MQAFGKPLPPSGEEYDEIPVRLESLEENQDGDTRLRITNRSGLLLFDNYVSGIPQSSLGILRKALILSRPTRNVTARSTYTLKKYSGFTHDASSTNLDICVRILVQNAKSLLDDPGLPRRSGFLDLFPQREAPSAPKTWSPRDFYDNVYVPVSDRNDAYCLPSTERLQCSLYPFQKRAVRWLLEREGVETGLQKPGSEPLPHGFVESRDSDGRTCFASSLLHIMTTDEGLMQSADTSIKGGILSEVSVLDSRPFNSRPKLGSQAVSAQVADSGHKYLLFHVPKPQLITCPDQPILTLI